MDGTEEIMVEKELFPDKDHLENCLVENNVQIKQEMNDTEDDIVITEEMLAVDEETRLEILEEEQRIKEKSEEYWKNKKEARFEQLLKLLNKSKFYTQYLKNKMDEHLKVEQLKHNDKPPNSKVKSSNNKLENHQRQLQKGRKKRRQFSGNVDDTEIQESNKKRKTDPDENENGNLPSKEDSFSRTINGEPVSDLQPKLFTGGVMRNYQLEGFEWLKVLYQNGVNGILADEMGLGKTIQCIALICHLMEMNVPGPYLICSPLSTLPNWISEFKRFAPKIPIVLYHGSKEERGLLRKNISIKKNSSKVENLPVVITSYEIVIRDRKYLQRYKWKYIIIDEGHRIKNYNCTLIRELKRYNSSNRLLLTGTPLQNNLSELWSLLNFLLPEIFDNLELFESWFDVPSADANEFDEKIVAEEREMQVLSTLHEILSPFLLRRIKSDVELFIPPKKELLVYAPLCALQETYYRATMDKTLTHLLKGNAKHEEQILVVKGDEESKALRSKFKPESDSCSTQKSELSLKMQNILMQLRKCCNHPYLISYPFTDDEQFQIDEELIQNSGKMLVLDAMLPKLLERGHKILLFSQMTRMLDILEDYFWLRKISFSRIDGSFSLETRMEEIKKFNEDPKVGVFLISTRAGGLGLNLTAADTVIIYDSDWNPQCDLQAMDRCHRIGQTNTVIVYRFITANTIDQKIIERAAGKRKLEKMVMHKDKFKSGLKEKTISTIDPDELLKLLKSTDHESVFTPQNSGKVFSDEELEALLDRSTSDNFQQMKNENKKVIFEEVKAEEQSFFM